MVQLVQSDVNWLCEVITTSYGKHFCQDLALQDSDIALYNSLTFWSLTYRLLLTYRGKALRWRLREAGPIASDRARQCVSAHRPCWFLFQLWSQVLHRKTHLVIWIYMFLKLMCNTAHCYDLPGPLKIILTQWPAVPYSYSKQQNGAQLRLEPTF